MFALIVPGQPLINELQQVSETSWTIDLMQPNSISLLTFLITQPLPEGYAAALSWTIPPFISLEFLGAVANERPSDTFHTGWSFNPDTSSSPTVKLVISLEMISNISELVLNKMSTDVRQEYAKKVALNLFRFMESFNKNTGHEELLVLPSDILDKWLTRFDEKFRLDPLFVLRTE